MKLHELMMDRTLDASYEGQITSDDMVLAVNLDGADNVNNYIVAQPYISEHSGSIDSQTEDSQYIRTGKTTTRTDATRSISVNGDRYTGDPFQDAILAHAIKYGTGGSVVKDYVYFAIQTGKGEKGKITINVNNDASGAAGAKASFGATLTSVGTPSDYTYPGV